MTVTYGYGLPVDRPKKSNNKEPISATLIIES